MEEELILKAKQGNREALARLLHENYEIVFKYMVKFALSRNIAEDLTQETMIKAIEKIDMYDMGKAKFSTWLITIGKNTYLDSLRRKKREQKYIETDIKSSELYEFIDEHDESMECVLEALGRLTEESRAPVVLKHYYGYSLEEIASMMSIPLGTVKSRIHNALKTIRKELG